ncbi:MAG: peptidase S41, partial [Janthinobacterium lividum]|nr:peptidase S41 [Janthinobacterium lividum]
MPELLSGIDMMSMPPYCPDRYLDARMKISRTLATLLFSAGLLGNAAAAPASSYFRFPAVRGDSVVFTAEGDLWKSSVHGGAAQRLTTHPGYETNAAMSRDGLWLAFSAAYEGVQEAYVMPLAGGLPRRISYDNGAVLVLGWTAQGEVLVSTQGTDGPASRRIVAAIDP